MCFHKMLIAVTWISFCFAGCNKNEESKAAPPTSISKSAAPAPAAPAPAAPAPASASASAEKKPMTALEDIDLGNMLKAIGWSYLGGGAMGMGATKTITVTAKKSGITAKVTLIKPTGQANTSRGIKMATAKDQAARFEAKGAVHLDGDALLAVIIENDKAASQKLLDELKQQIK